MKLLEGLRENDLEGLVIPVISIDQYESKIDDDAIVVAFFVEYKDPALDLNRFIQKSAAEILDTEVSPAPTEDGYYVVFVEILRNKKFLDILSSILENLSNLVSNVSWRFIAYGVEGVHDLDAKNLLSYIRLTAENEEIVQDDVKEFFTPSSLDDLLIEGRLLTFKRQTLIESYEIMEFDNELALISRYRVHLNSALANANRPRQRAEALLGAGWLVETLEHGLIIGNVFDDRLMVLRHISI